MDADEVVRHQVERNRATGVGRGVPGFAAGDIDDRLRKLARIAVRFGSFVMAGNMAPLR